MIWFIIKVLIFLFFYIWLRGTLPRLRYDQFMRFGWKRLIPTACVWIMLVATFRTVFDEVRRPHALVRRVRHRARAWCS